MVMVFSLDLFWFVGLKASLSGKQQTVLSFLGLGMSITPLNMMQGMKDVS
jgi:hypothetical protein